MTEKQPIKVRGGEAGRVIELEPKRLKGGEIKYDPVTKHIYVYVPE